ncbi:Multidrug efflux pump subunit AcrB [Lachnospiraceae bacterium XBB1006]|nr:Multidrug efflux pump subunit AcrB [Lachnospiraceae bacterium XBB1006]
MISKISVKKPYTVIVGIVLVLILGYIAVTRMSTDLLPSMNFPYAIVITSDVGASPEEVEKKISAPIEAAMASMTDIKKVSSVSQDNVSMVVLEFEQNANMDAITVEMRESLDALKAQWDDNVGNPGIMKINPDMMPILISAISKEGMSAQELTEYVENEVVPEVESVAGIARVTVSGGIKTTIEITLDSDKIAKLNKEVRKALSKKFADAEADIRKARNSLNSRGSQLKSGQDKLIASTTEAVNKLTDQKVELMQSKAKLNEKLVEMKASLTGNEQIDATIQRGIKSIEKNIKQMEAGIETINDNLAKLHATQISGAVDMGSASAQMASGKTSLSDALASLKESKKAAYDAADLTKILTQEAVGGMLSAQNFDMPAGYVEKNGEKYLIRVGDDLSEKKELDNLILLDMDLKGVKPIYLKDIAKVTFVDDSSDVYTSINGEPGILLTMEKQTGYSTGDVTKAAIAKMESLEKQEKGLNAETIMDQGIYIGYIVNSVVQNMVVGGLLAILILFLFLRDLKPTLVIAISIPVSVVTAVVLMYFSNVTLNVISLSGLALGIGMLVDNSIVVIENIYRLRNLGLPVKEAAVKGAKQVAGAIVASTLTTACVFLPIVFTDGITRQLFVDMGLTIAYSLFASLLIALSFVPMMASGVLAKNKEKEHKIFDRIQNAYASVLKGALRVKPLVLLLALGLLVASAYASMSRGTAFLPSMESTQMTATMEVPKEMKLDEARAISDKMIAKIMEIKDVETVGAMTGSGGGMGMMSMGNSGNSRDITMYLLLKEDKSLSNVQIAKQIEEKTKNMGAKLTVQTSAMDISSFMASGIQVHVEGRDLDKLQGLAKQVQDVVEKTPGTKEISSGMDEMTNGVKITVDKKKAAKYSLTVAQVFQNVSKEVADAKSATTLSTDTADYDVFVKSDQETDMTIAKLKKMKLDYKTMEGEEKKVSLKKVASIQNQASLSQISREAQNRYINVTAQIDEKHNVGLVSNAIKKELKKLSVPEGYSVSMAGEDETINDAMKQLTLMLLVAVAFIYLIMVAQFQSLLSPFIIMFTIPLAFTGGFLGLFLTGNEVSVIAMLGFVMLAGIIVNNGIVLVDYVNQLRETGMDKKTALIEAGRTRLRPIMMTALTTILAMSTTAIGAGMGSDMVQPMAIVTIGGLIYGTLLTLFVVPCMYDLLHREKSMVKEEIDDDISNL